MATKEKEEKHQFHKENVLILTEQFLSGIQVDVCRRPVRSVVNPVAGRYMLLVNTIQ